MIQYRDDHDRDHDQLEFVMQLMIVISVRFDFDESVVNNDTVGSIINEKASKGVAEFK